MNDTIKWLLEGSPCVQYRTRLDLLGQKENDLAVITVRQKMIEHPQILELVAELKEWHSAILKNHKDAKHLIHKLTFLADLGLTIDDPGINQIVDKIMEHQAPEGTFQIKVNIPVRFGGTGKDQWSWMLCDAPSVVYALIIFGLKDDPGVQLAIKYLAELIRENGWGCAASPDLGKFRGPGRKDDPCPYANLIMLKLLSELPEYQNSDVCRTGVNTLLDLWEHRKERRPYLFAMGSDFAKLKAPLIWYDILHVLEVLTRFKWLHQDSRLKEMLEIVKSKQNEDGSFSPESIWMAWKGWDFGQKREPSQWVTFLILRILKRMESY